MLNSTLLLFKNIISIKKSLQLSDLTTFKNSRVEIHQILALVFWKIGDTKKLKTDRRTRTPN